LNDKTIKEIKIHGLYACKGVVEHRQHDVIRLYLTESRATQFSGLMKWCAKEKKAYHIVTDQELEKVTDTVHHEGVCILAKARPPLREELFLNKALENPACFLYLDGVGNPHNIGAIIRTCAHFGITAIIGEKGKLSPLTPAGYRIAEGGAEHVKMVIVDSGAAFFEKAKQKKFQLVGTSSYKGSPLYEAKLNPKTIFIMGAEVAGMTKGSFSASSQILKIPGSGKVESLNVSTATALLTGEYYRQHQSGK
jgi:RNA methyltransferase, TrmH family